MYLASISSIPLSAAQAIRIHGWMSPSRRLGWQTVKSRTDLTFNTLYTILSNYNVRVHTVDSSKALDALYALQPSLHEWIQYNKVSLVDYEVVHLRWKANPVDDFQRCGKAPIKIGEVLEAGLSHEALKGCGFTLDVLMGIGMTADIMPLFHLTFQEWLDLGLKRRHIEFMTPDQTQTIFGFTKTALESSLA